MLTDIASSHCWLFIGRGCAQLRALMRSPVAYGARSYRDALALKTLCCRDLTLCCRDLTLCCRDLSRYYRAVGELSTYGHVSLLAIYRATSVFLSWYCRATDARVSSTIVVRQKHG